MQPNQILKYWLGTLGESPPPREQVDLWFGADEIIDQEIRDQFGVACEEAIGGGFRDWESEPRSHVALIIVLDQFPRNLFRGNAKSFAGDPRAISLTRALSESAFRELHPIERYFSLMPYMHSEELSDQLAGEAAFALSIEAVPTSFRSFFERGLGFATRHRVVIEAFSRFPHRNEVLGRSSTEAEKKFLVEHSGGF